MTNETPPPENLPDGFAAKLDVILEAHFSDSRFGVRDLFERFPLSQSTFERKVKEHADFTPEQYLLRFRLEKAWHLLLTSRASVGAVADQTGFRSHSYFTRSFVVAYGNTPKEERKKAKSAK